MSLYVMSDLHLSNNTDKSMEVFGSRWTDYTAKIKRNWNAIINDDDTVIIPGDISWASSLEESLPDLTFLDSLPGKKLIGKGNHDFWWSTVTKMNAFFEQNNIGSIKLLYNNAYETEDFIVCGTRGWFYDEKQQSPVNNADYDKVMNREVQRLKLSLEEAYKLKNSISEEKEILVFLHFPPVWNNFICREIIDTLKEYKIKRCYFGHIHGNYTAPRTQIFENVKLIMTAADYLQFSPMPIFPDYE